MSKTSRLPARHGDDHNPDGYDPIRKMLAWGQNTDPNPAGNDGTISLDSPAGTIHMNWQDDSEFVVDGTLEQTVDQYILDVLTGNMFVTSFLGIQMNSTTEGILLEGDDGVVIRLNTGSGSAVVFEVRDGAGNALLRVDADGDIHIKTGKTITADL